LTSASTTLPPCRVVRYHAEKPTPFTVVRSSDPGIAFARPSPCIVTPTTYLEKVEKCLIKEEELQHNVIVKHVCDGSEEIYIYPNEVWSSVKDKYIEPLLSGEAPRNPGLLLIGPPGTGKSSMLHILATSLGLNVVRIDPSSILSEFIGRSEQNLAKIFKAAEDNEPSIIIADEAEWVLAPRNLSQVTDFALTHVGMMNVVLTKLQSYHRKRSILFAAATNMPPSHLDQALLRSGRFGKPIFVPLPDVEAAKEYMTIKGIDPKRAEEWARKLVNAGASFADIAAATEDLLQGKEPRLEVSKRRGYVRFAPSAVLPREEVEKLLRLLGPHTKLHINAPMVTALPVVASLAYYSGRQLILVTEERYLDEVAITASMTKSLVVVLTNYVSDHALAYTFLNIEAPIIYVGSRKPNDVPSYPLRISIKKRSVLEAILRFFEIAYNGKDIEKLLSLPDRRFEEVIGYLPCTRKKRLGELL